VGDIFSKDKENRRRVLLETSGKKKRGGRREVKEKGGRVCGQRVRKNDRGGDVKRTKEIRCWGKMHTGRRKKPIKGGKKHEKGKERKRKGEKKKKEA